MKNWKRLCPALLLGLALSLFLAVPAGASPAPATALPDPADGVITLTQDVELSSTWEVTEDTTLDLNGHTLSFGSAARGIKVHTEDVKLTVNDSSDGKTGKITVNNAGEDDDTVAISVKDAILVLNGGTVESLSTRYNRDTYGVHATGNFDVTVNEATVTATFDCAGTSGQPVRSGPRAIYTDHENDDDIGVVTINEGATVRAVSTAQNINPTKSPYATSVWSNNQAKGQIFVTINGGDISVTANESNARAVWNFGENNAYFLRGGSITANSTDGDAYAVSIWGGEDNLILGGTYSAETAMDIIKSDTRVTVYGGGFTGGFKGVSTEKLSLKGGGYATETDLSDCVADGYQKAALAGGSYSYGVILKSDAAKAARVIDAESEKHTDYPSLQDALCFAKDGDTVQPLEDMEPLPLVMPNAVTLDLNGKTVSFGEGVRSALNVAPKLDLTITDSSPDAEGALSLVSDEDDALSSCVYAVRGSVLTLKEGSIRAETSGDGSSVVGVFTNVGCAVNMEGGSVTVNAGSNSYAYGIYASRYADISVTGGTVFTQGGAPLTLTDADDEEGGSAFSVGVTEFGTITIDGEETEITAAAYGYDSYAVGLAGRNDVEITMNNGTVNVHTAGEDSYAYGLGLSWDGTISVNDGYINVLSQGETSEAAAVMVEEDGMAVVNGGELTVRAEDAGSDAIGVESHENLVINGGSVEVTATGENGWATAVSCDNDSDSVTTVQISNAFLSAETLGVGGYAQGADCSDNLQITDSVISAVARNAESVAYGVRTRDYDSFYDEDAEENFNLLIRDSSITACVPLDDNEENSGSAIGVCAGAHPTLSAVTGRYTVDLLGKTEIFAFSQNGAADFYEPVLGVIASDTVNIPAGQQVLVQAISQGNIYLTAGVTATHVNLAGGIVEAERPAEADTGSVFAVMSNSPADDDGIVADDSINISGGIFVARGGADCNVVFDGGSGPVNTVITGGWFSNDPNAICRLDDELVERIQAEKDAACKAALDEYTAARDALDEARENPEDYTEEQMGQLQQAYDDAYEAYLVVLKDLFDEVLVFQTADGVPEGYYVKRHSPNPDYPDYADAHYLVVAVPSGSGGGGGGARAFAIQTKANEGGSVTADRSQASAGTTVTVTAAPDQDYYLEALNAWDDGGNPVTLSKTDDGVYTFTMPAAKVTVIGSFLHNGITPAPVPSGDYDPVETCRKTAPFCPLTQFKDLNPSAWYHDGIHYALTEKIMQGMSADLFAPNSATTRSMIVTMLWRQEGQPEAPASSFTDVPAGSWYASAVNWAAANGLVMGYSETTFGPDDPVTREQMTAILYRYAQYRNMDVSVGEDTNILSYDDISSLSHWAYPSMQWAVGAGLIQGKGSEATLAPLDNTTRAEVATLFLRLAQL